MQYCWVYSFGFVHFLMMTPALATRCITTTLPSSYTRCGTSSRALAAAKAPVSGASATALGTSAASAAVIIILLSP